MLKPNWMLTAVIMVGALSSTGLAEEGDGVVIRDMMERLELAAQQRHLQMRRRLMQIISLQFKDSPIDEAVAFLRTTSKLNMVIARDILGPDERKERS